MWVGLVLYTDLPHAHPDYAGWGGFPATGGRWNRRKAITGGYFREKLKKTPEKRGFSGV